VTWPFYGSIGQLTECGAGSCENFALLFDRQLCYQFIRPKRTDAAGGKPYSFYGIEDMRSASKRTVLTMKRTPFSLVPSLAAAAVALTALAAANFASGQQITTNWAAYNDHRAGPAIPPHVPVATNWGTALRVTRYDMGAPADTVAAPLTNFYTGDQLPVTMTVLRTGAPDDFGALTGPFTNTPAGDLFFRVVDLSNVGIVGVDAAVGGGTVDFVTFTFNGLNPSKRYIFRGTSARGGGYVPRWTVATITNVNGFINAHINGIGTDPISRVLTEADFSPDLGPGQAAWNGGDNKEGAVVGWDFIAPALDGSFSIIVEQYTNRISATQTANDANYGYSFGAILLAEVETAPPVITANPPAQTTVEQNRPFALSVTAEGIPLLYQWYRNNTPIPGATRSTFSVALAAVSDSGDYYVVVSNDLRSVTSTVARVTVTADVTAPSVTSAFSFPTFDPATQVATLNQITVEFNEAVQAGSVDDPFQYLISGGIGNPSSVTFTNGRSVILELSTPLTEDTDYTVQVTGGPTDLAGNSAGALNSAFHSWMRGPGNALLFEYYNTGLGVDVVTLTSHPSFPNSPTFRTNLWAFDTRVVFPDDSQGEYGSRVSGVFIPPFSGDWVFFLRTWDRGAVYFNPNGLDPAGKIEILHETTGNDPRDWNKFTSAPFRLQGGQGYYIEGLQKADALANIDVIKVAARPADTGYPTLGVPNTAVDTNALMGGYIASPLAPRDLGGGLSIAQQPMNQTVEDNHDVTFSVGVNNPSRAPLFYQWFRGGVEIAGATGPTYTFAVTSADDNATFSVRVAKVGSVVTSAMATLDVIPDNRPPNPIEVLSYGTNLFNVVVRFDERLSQASAEDQFKYDVQADGFGFPFSATLQPDGKTVTLVYQTPLESGTTYTIKISEVTDLVGNAMGMTNLTFVAGQGGSPRLRVAYVDGYVDISWPAPSTGFVLEESANLSNPSGWTAVSQTPAVINGRNTVSLTPGPGLKAYRLKQ
jgi:hypothetical protein